MFVIGLDRPKNPINIGGVMRAAGCFGAASVVVSGTRCRVGCTDTMKAYRRIPLIRATGDLLGSTPYSCTPVVVEMIPRTTPLPEFTHPKRAFYIFGPEDGSVLTNILDRCHNVVHIPAGCLNLAVAVNIVLYDRVTKMCKGATSNTIASGEKRNRI